MGSLLQRCKDERTGVQQSHADNNLSQVQSPRQVVFHPIHHQSGITQIKEHIKLNQSVKYTLQHIDEILGRSVQGRYPNGDGPIFRIPRHKATYQGVLVDDMPTGKGVAHFSNGGYYAGDFINGDADGQGIYIYPDGTLYEGQFFGSKFNGWGYFVYVDQRMKYQGNFVDGVPNGQGKQSYKDGSMYQGNFQKGVKSGRGVYQWVKGIRYQGGFVNGLMHGKGILSDNKNIIYRGQFEKGLKCGSGVYRTQLGTYQGIFDHDYLNGNGTFVWNDGKVYQGNFYHSMMHGKGIMYYPTNQIAQGQWQNNHSRNLQHIRNDESASEKIREIKTRHEMGFMALGEETEQKRRPSEVEGGMRSSGKYASSIKYGSSIGMYEQDSYQYGMYEKNNLLIGKSNTTGELLSEANGENNEGGQRYRWGNQ